MNTIQEDKQAKLKELSGSLLNTSTIIVQLEENPLELDSVGKQYLKHLVKQLKDLNIYLDGDIELLLTDCAINYQLYRYYLERSVNEEKTYNHMKSMRHLKVVQDYSKQLGIGPLQRHKLKAFKELKEDTIFDQIETLMDDD